MYHSTSFTHGVFARVCVCGYRVFSVCAVDAQCKLRRSSHRRHRNIHTQTHSNTQKTRKKKITILFRNLFAVSFLHLRKEKKQFLNSFRIHHLAIRHIQCASTTHTHTHTYLRTQITGEKVASRIVVSTTFYFLIPSLVCLLCPNNKNRCSSVVGKDVIVPYYLS